MLNEGEKRAIVWGAIVGAVWGSLLAVLFRRWTRQRQMESGKPIRTGQVLRLGMSMVRVVRQFLKLIS